MRRIKNKRSCRTVKVKATVVDLCIIFSFSCVCQKYTLYHIYIPGAEASDTVGRVGSHVNNSIIKKDVRVVLLNKVFDEICNMCLNGIDIDM